MATMAMSGMRSIQRQLDNVVSINAEKLRQVAVMRRSNRDRIIGLQFMLILEDPFEIDEIAMEHMGHANRFIAARKTLYEMATSTAESDALDQIRITSMVAAPINDRIRDLVLDEQQEEAKELMIAKLLSAQNDIYSQFEILAQIYKDEAKRSIEKAQRKYDAVYGQTIIILIAVVGLCIFIAIQIIRRINRSETSLVKHMDKLERTVEDRTIELKQESKRLAVTLASIGDGVITINNDGAIQYMNPTAEALTQLTHEQVSGKPVDTVLRSINQETGDECPLLATGTSKSTDSGRPSDRLMLRANGDLLDIHKTVADITDDNGQTHGKVVVLRDVSKARALERRLAHEATHDPLTGLVNRREFELRINNAIKRAVVDKSPHTLCYIDLDRFKAINDSCGHAVGDRLLCELSELVRAHLRKIDTFARLGGDEFGLLFEQCPIAKGSEIAESIRQAISAFQVVHENQVFSVGVSIGIVEISTDTNDLETLLRVADAACYAAKEKGGGSVQIYRATDDDIIQLQSETRLAGMIRDALDKNDLELHCQPIVGICKRHSHHQHYEVLMRIRNSQGEIVYPGAFLPAAERYDLLTSIDHCVITKTFYWIGKHSKILNGSRLSINITGDSLSDSNFLNFVTETFQMTGANPTNVIFEITENVAITNLSAAIEFIKTLTKLGCEFALDDFGRGFSSFGSLKDLPVHYIKIDGSFVREILENSADEATVIAINEIGHALGKFTVAEFVESQAIQEHLLELGINYVQGFGIDKPFPIDDLIESKSITPSSSD